MSQPQQQAGSEKEFASAFVTFYISNLQDGWRNDCLIFENFIDISLIMIIPLWSQSFGLSFLLWHVVVALPHYDVSISDYLLLRSIFLFR